jgi:23S rRNA (cytosine1962-C5)-methyltransferase
VKIAGRVLLKPNRDGPVRGGNPWIFSQAIESTEPPELAPGDSVEVFNATGELLGIGYFNPRTTIAVRMLTFGATGDLAHFVRHRIRDAQAFRQKIISPLTNCYRLINGEGDAFPGVVVDRYADVAVVQLLTAGADRLRDEITSALQDLLAPRAILERSYGAVRRQEGLADRGGWLTGEPVAATIVKENGIKLCIDFERGQKTGYFLDQRENRALLGKLAAGLRIFDGYCYAGGFTLAALQGGAKHVIAVDTSRPALESARRNLELNGCSPSHYQLVCGEAVKYLLQSQDQFDIVVLDPPPLARNLKDAVRAANLYGEINRIAMQAIAKGGFLMTFSCSLHVRAEDFARVVRMAAARAKRNFRLLHHLGPGPDHPVMLGHNEGEYLTGLLLSDLR